MTNCQQCNFVNPPEMRFCSNCGAPLENAAPALPPTVFGAMPQIPPVSPVNQPNAFQNQPNFAPPPPHQPPVYAAPKKSKLSKFLLIGGGIVVLAVIGVFGMFVYDKTLGSYFYKQRLEKEFREKQSKADRLAAKDVLPESIRIKTQDVGRGQMLEKADLLDAIKTKMPQLNSEAKNINDGAAAIYAAPDKKQALLQVFKYNSPEQAQRACQEIGREMIKNKDNFLNPPYFGYDDRPGFCGISGEIKTGDYVSVNSLFGFLYISTGYKDYAGELSSAVWAKLR